MYAEEKRARRKVKERECEGRESRGELEDAVCAAYPRMRKSEGNSKICDERKERKKRN